MSGISPDAEVAVLCEPGSHGDGQLEAAAARLAIRVRRTLHPHDLPAGAKFVTGDLRGAAAGRFDGVPADLVRPGVKAMAVAHDRLKTKHWLAGLGIRAAPWAAVEGGRARPLPGMEFPAVGKPRFGSCDGLRRARFDDAARFEQEWKGQFRSRWLGPPFILETLLPQDRIGHTVVMARGANGETVRYDLIRCAYSDGRLVSAEAPAPFIGAAEAAEAAEIAAAMAEDLDYVGVLAVQLLRGAAGWLVNGFRPGPHPAGNWTQDGAATCQYENHLRAVCGLPLGAAARTCRQASTTWLDRRDWAAALAEPGACLHVHPHRGGTIRRIGHVNRIVT